MTKPTIRVPFGLDEHGKEVRAQDASREHSYVCPDCRTPLTPKLGEKNVRHFAHRIDSAVCDFRHETEEHYRAKKAIVAAVNTGLSIKLIRKCEPGDHEYAEPLPNAVAKATTEFCLATGHRADVALFDMADNVVGIIEVLMTHEVDQEKALALAEAQIPWVEVSALAVLDANEPTWPLTQDFFQSPTCNSCIELQERARGRLQAIINREIRAFFWRQCPSCHRDCQQTLPSRVCQVAFGHPLQGGAQAFAALSDSAGEVIALLEPMIAHEIKEPRKREMNASRLHWAAVGIEDLLQSEWPLNIRVRVDHFPQLECADCRKAQALAAEEARRREERASLVRQHAAERPVLGYNGREIECPVPGRGRLDAVACCAACEYFLDSRPGALLCFGGAHSAIADSEG